MYNLCEFVREHPKILVSCAYFDILLVACEMIDPLLGVQFSVIFIIPFVEDMFSPYSDLGRFIISSSIFFLLLFIFLTSYVSFSYLSPSYVY